jgi:hypothetical protein
MNKTRRLNRSCYFLLIISICLQSFLIAQDIEFKAIAEPSVLTVGEQFTITYESNQKISDIDLPDFNNFQVLGGPSIGQSTQIESSPGKTYTKTTYSYTYYLRAVKAGKFNLGPATAKIKNKSIQSNPVLIEVVAGGQSTPGSNVQPSHSSEGAQAASTDDVFVRLILNKREAYVGEQILATVKIYTRVTLAGIDQNYKGPDFTGFYTEPIEVPLLRNLERENVDGVIYYTGILQKAVIIPQKSGELVIEPFELNVAVRQQVKRKTYDIFDDFFGPSVQDIPMKLKSNRITVKCKALPANKPSSFTGAVGEFTMTASVDKTKVKTNDAINYKIVIKGTGNYKIVDEPVITFPPDIEKYDPVIKTSAESPVKGIKTFEYLIIPHYPGEFNIPPVEFSYFDISSHEYRTIRSEGFTISVEKSTGDTLLPVYTGLAKEDVKMLTSDIQYIKLKNKLPLFNGKFLISSIWFYFSYIFLTLIFCTLIILRRNHIKKSGDILMVRNRKANKYAQKRLKKAAKLVNAANKNVFYDELLKAIWLYLSDKLIIPLADLSKENARNSLVALHVNDEVIKDLFNIINECEFARYAPASESVNAAQLLEKTEKLIVRLQQELS